jgi:hypothetical protein
MPFTAFEYSYDFFVCVRGFATNRKVNHDKEVLSGTDKNVDGLL